MPYKTKDIFDKQLLKTLLKHLLFLVIIFYFIYHTLSGERGYIKMISLNKEIIQKQDLLFNLEQQRKKLDEKVKLLHPNTLNKDIIDELARGYFNLIGKDEIVIYKSDIEKIQNTP